MKAGAAPMGRMKGWVQGRPLRKVMGLALLAGAVSATGHAPLNLWPLAILGFAGLYALFRIAGGWRRAALVGWSGGTGYFLVALSWIIEPFLVDVARHGWMAPFALVLMAAGLALFWALAFGLARVLGGRGLIWVVALTGAEMLRGILFTGFPWALVGHVLIASPALQLAAYGGALGLTATVLALAVSLCGLVGPRPLPALLGPGLFAALLYWGAAQPAPAPTPDAPLVRMTQPNAPQHEKWDPEKAPGFFRRQLGFTAATTDTARPDLIVWPETSVPVWLNYADDALAAVADAAGGVPVVLGVQRQEGMRIYNSAARIDAGGQVGALYDKHHLVPFGEYMPLGDILARWGIHGLAASEGRGYSSGPGARLMEVPGIGAALPLICYEAVFPRDVATAPARPRFLLQITNDAWFGRISGPYQHLAQARLRAVEQGLPMVRVANTGVSAMIGPRGTVRAQIPLGQAGFVDAALPPALPPTPYARSGDGPIALLIFLCLGGFGLNVARMRRTKSH
ncbi:apolipoprotein N-acyltransferase [Lutimaribacter sp. EGI FJ00015]|uniref:Apolipoprotein N-acyltransferase n=1 Tax=Lutimaribacter degradans TaxID=2945989 RepID=A0ACC5ZY95_9RHOB|nr:apolipoprotein N-acyltransferase [Lutimaribacter sp. EGI FJ00013]MCM2563022.1 apolipoprotein N-acyltransferase [Lutimaribacter sp. EGI FJ00013]MCO0614190.1 apolipoprotein N-acyltransferase [Lutimaribacter sp. EGI FJ00015]MCO0636167.1 apolipoprotein N-acyltransferase [Lutimaribacter sp. EGI FJ00014]